MGKTLEDFWYGNINPQEQSIEHNQSIEHLVSLMGKNRDVLSATLTEEQKEVLEKYDDCTNELSGLFECEIFIYAFRLGGRLMLEILGRED